MKKQTTRRALVMSLLSLLLCASMLVGTTFAWFTDSVTSGMNKIVAGNLDVELDYYDGDSWETVEGATELFTGNLWEPGHTEVVKLKVANEGTLALKYQFAINIASETAGENVAGAEFKLSDYIYFGTTDEDITDRASAIAAVESGAQPIKNGKTMDGALKAGEETELTLVVYMPETVGNEANYKTGTTAPEINLGLNLLATQETFEEDSFDSNYDENAKYPLIPKTVTTLAELTEVLDEGGHAVLAESVETSSLLSMPAGAILDGGERTVKYTSTTSGSVVDPEGGAVKNLVIDGGGFRGATSAIGSIQYNGTALDENLVLENVDVVNTRMAIDVDAKGNSVYVKDSLLTNAIQIIDADEIVFENCHFTSDNFGMPFPVGSIQITGSMTFINCHFEESVNFYLDNTRCSGTLRFNGCTYGNNGVQNRPFEPTAGFFTYWLEYSGYGYSGTFGVGQPARTNFTVIVDDTVVWEAQ